MKIIFIVFVTLGFLFGGGQLSDFHVTWKQGLGGLTVLLVVGLFLEALYLEFFK